MKRFAFSIFFLFLMTCPFVAQTGDRWTRLGSERDDFSISVPADFLINNSEKDISRIYAFKDGTTISISIEKSRDGKRRFKQIKFKREANETHEPFQTTGFIGRRVVFDWKKNYRNVIYMGSADGFYTISVSGKLPNETMTRILASILLEGAPLFTSFQNSSVWEKSIPVNSIATSSQVSEYLAKPDSENIIVEYSKDSKKDDEEEPTDETNYSRNLIILRKIRADYTDGARSGGIEGIVKLKVTFLATGQIGKVQVVSSPDKGLTKNVLRVVKKVKFIPAEVAGKPVDVDKYIEYSFSLY